MPSATKRKGTSKTLGATGVTPKKARILRKDEELSDDDDNDDRAEDAASASEGSDEPEDKNETVDETRLRLAQEYLKVITESARKH